jgi:bifunctional DNA-binding transcriptional regulator/antitoxin component of YhaV-PrlF toxin-antitoxin module
MTAKGQWTAAKGGPAAKRRDYIVLRKVNKALRLLIPTEDVKELGLKAGDQVAWDREPSGKVTLTFIKQSALDKLVDA